MMPMQFIVGLGNPGEKYQLSRHNIGFVVLEELLRQFLAKKTGLAASSPDLSTHLQPKFFAKVLKHDDLLFIEPQTFMNESGKAVRAVMEYYDKEVDFSHQSVFSQLWVIHDDLDIPVGSYKIQFGTGPKVHNGLSSVDKYLHTQQYWHVRIGVDGREGDRSVPSQSYVLSPFTDDEKKVLATTIQKVCLDILGRLAEPL